MSLLEESRNVNSKIVDTVDPGPGLIGLRCLFAIYAYNPLYSSIAYACARKLL